jgi:hypothetical protein
MMPQTHDGVVLSRLPNGDFCSILPRNATTPITNTVSSTSPSAESDDVNVAEALDQLRDLGGDAFVAQIAKSFTQQAERFFADSRSADLKTIQAGAHRLRGVGAQLRANDFVSLFQQLEDAAERGDSEALPRLIDEAEAAFAAIQPRLSNP